MIVEQNLFSPALADELRKHLRLRNMFSPATVTGDASWRVGRVYHIQELFVGKLVAERVLAYAHDALRLDATTCEVQLSSYGDGEYFRAHSDSGTPDVAHRRLSWVSYLNAWPGPNPFSGGELILYEDHATTTYAPADGETVFFPSELLHEVTTVAAPPGWENRRFTVNGWLS